MHTEILNMLYEYKLDYRVVKAKLREIEEKGITAMLPAISSNSGEIMGRITWIGSAIELKKHNQSMFSSLVAELYNIESNPDDRFGYLDSLLEHTWVIVDTPDGPKAFNYDDDPSGIFTINS